MIYKNCIRFFGNYLLPSTVLCTASGAFSAVTGSGIIKLAGVSHYDPLDHLTQGALGGAFLGLIDSVVLFLMDRYIPDAFFSLPNPTRLVCFQGACSIFSAALSCTVGNLPARWFFDINIAAYEAIPA